MNKVSRETFADEGSWLEYNANQAEMRRREALRRAARYMTPKQREEARRVNALHKRILIERPRWRRHMRVWRAANPERAREIKRAGRQRHPEQHRAENKRWYDAHHDYAIQWRRQYRLEHRDERIQYDREYSRMHREERLAYRHRPDVRARNIARLRALRANDPAYRERDIARMRSRRAQKPNYRGYEAIRRNALALEAEVLALRAEGWTVREVAELTGSALSAVERAITRARKRQQQQQAS